MDMATTIESLLGTNIAALLLSWVLIFTLTYAVLLKSKALGEDVRIMGVVAVVISFFAVAIGAPILGVFFSSLFSSMALVLGGLLVAILLLAMSGADVTKFLGGGKISVVLAIVAVAIFISALNSIGRGGVSSDVLSTVIILGVLGAAVAYVTGK